MGLVFGTRRAQKRDRFPVTLSHPTLVKMTGKPKSVTFLRPKNGHVFGTRKHRKVDPENDQSKTPWTCFGDPADLKKVPTACSRY